jgi:hypothetical protein
MKLQNIYAEVRQFDGDARAERPRRRVGDGTPAPPG